MKFLERLRAIRKVGPPYFLREAKPTNVDWDGRKKRVRELRDEGFSMRQIADLLGVSKGTLYYWLSGRERRARRIAEGRERVRERFKPREPMSE